MTDIIINKKVEIPPKCEKDLIPKKIMTKEEIEKYPRGVKKSIPDEIREQYYKDYRKKYYESNKEKFNGDIVCEICKIRFGRSNNLRHLKSKNHLKNLENLEIFKEINKID